MLVMGGVPVPPLQFGGGSVCPRYRCGEHWGDQILTAGAQYRGGGGGVSVPPVSVLGGPGASIGGGSRFPRYRFFGGWEDGPGAPMKSFGGGGGSRFPPVPPGPGFVGVPVALGGIPVRGVTGGWGVGGEGGPGAGSGAPGAGPGRGREPGGAVRSRFSPDRGTGSGTGPARTAPTRPGPDRSAPGGAAAEPAPGITGTAAEHHRENGNGPADNGERHRRRRERAAAAGPRIPRYSQHRDGGGGGTGSEPGRGWGGAGPLHTRVSPPPHIAHAWALLPPPLPQFLLVHAWDARPPPPRCACTARGNGSSVCRGGEGGTAPQLPPLCTRACTPARRFTPPGRVCTRLCPHSPSALLPSAVSR